MTTAAPNYAIRCSPVEVEVWATRSLSFDPKDWRRDLRSDLLLTLGRLSRAAAGLAVDFWDRDRRVLDLENAVMYNVGLAPFTRFLPVGLSMQRLGSPFLSEASLPAGEVAAQYRYVVTEPGSLERELLPSEALTLSFVAARPVTVRQVWRAARAQVTASDYQPDWTGRRLALRVEAPTGMSAGGLKPLLDGIVSALHVATDDMTLGVLADWSADSAELTLMTSGPAPLGLRPLITMAGRRPSWNPADHVLDQIMVRGSQTSGRCSVVIYPLPEA